MIYGIGVDLVENERMAAIISRWGSKFLERVFSTHEMEYCERHAHASINYGARFAAKEAFLKALGIGIGMGIKLNEIEVVNNDKGKPDLFLTGEAKAQIGKRKISKIHLSLTHTRKYSSAIVLLEKK